jgi:hypothetical protein
VQEFELGVSLYDEKLGAFYGCTSYSLHDVGERSSVTRQPTDGKHVPGGKQGRLDISFSYDVFMHTRINDPRCVAVVGSRQLG